MNLYLFIKPEKTEPKKDFFIQLRNYQDPDHKNGMVAWGCECPKCGAKHEFATGRGWNFCPACGCEAKE